MNRYLMMSAAALFASSTAAVADDSSKSHFSGTVSLGTCDYLALHYVQSGIVFAEHLYTHCGSGTNLIELGYEGKNAKGHGSSLAIGEMALAYNYHENYALMLDLSAPIKSGGTWALWVAFSQDSVFLAENGNYNVVDAPARKASGSTLAKVVEMLRQRGAAQKPVK
jgi:hypothetical protein